MLELMYVIPCETLKVSYQCLAILLTILTPESVFLNGHFHLLDLLVVFVLKKNQFGLPLLMRYWNSHKTYLCAEENN